MSRYDLVSFVRGRRIVLAIATVTIALGVMVEMALIALRASRGTTSHFNFSTPLNAAIFGTMGLFIVLVWTMSLLVAVLLLVQPLPDPLWAWTLRLGLLLSLIGMAVAYPMLRATPMQLASAHGGTLLYAGAHSVGVADGGPGLPLLAGVRRVGICASRISSASTVCSLCCWSGGCFHWRQGGSTFGTAWRCSGSPP